MSLRRLSAFVILAQVVAMGVFAAFFIGWIYSTGGRATVDITQFGEQHIEFVAMILLTATVPYALYIVDPTTGGSNDDGGVDG